MLQCSAGSYRDAFVSPTGCEQCSPGRFSSSTGSSGQLVTYSCFLIEHRLKAARNASPTRSRRTQAARLARRARAKRRRRTTSSANAQLASTPTQAQTRSPASPADKASSATPSGSRLLARSMLNSILLQSDRRFNRSRAWLLSSAEPEQHLLCRRLCESLVS